MSNEPVTPQMIGEELQEILGIKNIVRVSFSCDFARLVLVEANVTFQMDKEQVTKILHLYKREGEFHEMPKSIRAEEKSRATIEMIKSEQPREIWVHYQKNFVLFKEVLSE